MSRRDPACWAFGPPGAGTLVRNAELLLAHLPVFLAGWPFRRVAEDEGLEPAIAVAERAGGEIAVTTGGAESVFADAFKAANGLAGALVAGFVRRSGLLAVDAGSAQVGRGLAVLLGGPLSGKSSIALHMAAAGYRLFGAHRLALRLTPAGPPAGLCLGLTPRVRLPLPPDCGARFRDYVESFTEIRGPTAAWLKLWEGEAAGFMEDAPLAAFVLLERGESSPCSLTPAPAPDVAAALAAAGCSPPAAGAALAEVASRVPGYRLSFSSSREAAAALVAALRERDRAGSTGGAATSAAR
jgi:hypothetical protein